MCVRTPGRRGFPMARPALCWTRIQLRGAGTGWDLHEFRFSALTHLGEAGTSLLMLMAKSGHRKPENLRRYFKPSSEAIAELTSLLAPGDMQR